MNVMIYFICLKIECSVIDWTDSSSCFLENFSSITKTFFCLLEHGGELQKNANKSCRKRMNRQLLHLLWTSKTNKNIYSEKNCFQFIFFQFFPGTTQKFSTLKKVYLLLNWGKYFTTFRQSIFPKYFDKFSFAPTVILKWSPILNNILKENCFLWILFSYNVRN